MVSPSGEEPQCEGKITSECVLLGIFVCPLLFTAEPGVLLTGVLLLLLLLFTFAKRLSRGRQASESVE